MYPRRRRRCDARDRAPARPRPRLVLQGRPHPRPGAKLDALKASLAQARAERGAAGDKAEAEAKAAKKPDNEITKAMAEALHSTTARIDKPDRKSAIAELRMVRAFADGNIDEAKKQFALTKNIPSIRRAGIHFALGENEPAEKLAREAANADEGQLHPRAVLADLLWRMGEKGCRARSLQKLREALRPTRPRCSRLRPPRAPGPPN